MPDKRSKWPAARHVLQAADLLREMAWLAPFRDHEGGYGPWRAATRMAHGLLGIPDPDTCTICHTRVRPPKEQP